MAETIAENSIELSMEEYLKLEKFFQGLRLLAMRLAVGFAEKRQGLANIDVNRDDVYVALQFLVSTGLMKKDIVKFPQDTYVFLEKRLCNLRFEVAKVARHFNANIEEALKSIANNDSILRAALTPEDDPKYA